MDRIVYKWSPKGLKNAKYATPTERIVFMGKNSVFSYNVNTGTLVDIAWYKSIDSYLSPTKESIPDQLLLPKSLRMITRPSTLAKIKKYTRLWVR